MQMLGGRQEGQQSRQQQATGLNQQNVSPQQLQQAQQQAGTQQGPQQYQSQPNPQQAKAMEFDPDTDIPF